MKRFHVHLNVADLEANIRFYSTLFGHAPSVRKHDYAKWMLDDPRVNFAISSQGRDTGIDHLGLQAESGPELAEIGARLEAADAIAVSEIGTTCCYAQSDKYWAQDPQGTRWETFHTFADATSYYAPAAQTACGTACGPTAEHADSESAGAVAAAARSACCGPSAHAAGRGCAT